MARSERELDAQTNESADTDDLPPHLRYPRVIYQHDSNSTVNLTHKRKHSRIDVGLSSDTSGRFDDAEESDREPPEYQVSTEEIPPRDSKRRRSNGTDWPLRDDVAVYDEYGMRVKAFNDHGSRRNSPRSTASRTRRTHLTPSRAFRASRFTEGSMHDRASEKPPSIFIKEDSDGDGREHIRRGPRHVSSGAAPFESNATMTGSTSGLNHRQSGIFRFGKAIASAFNPFGVWGSVTDIWKGPSEENKSQKDILKQRQADAQKAYEELKRAGYKGTSKGNYLRDSQQATSQLNTQVNPDIADQTWKAIQEKMEAAYRTPKSSRISTVPYENVRAVSDAMPNQERAGTATPGKSEVGSAMRNPFQEIRKAKSHLHIPSVKRGNTSSPAPPIPSQAVNDKQLHSVRKQPSRKELERQQKLLKKVSNLEEKLERTRQELRELTGATGVTGAAGEDDFSDPAPSAEIIGRRKFVPGALPTLPSERLLNGRDGLSGFESESDNSAYPSLAYLVKNSSQASTPGTNPKTTPKPRKLSKEYKALRSDTPSKKRKPATESDVDVAKQIPNGESEVVERNWEATQAGTKRLPPRKSKVQKHDKTESPGSAEKKRQVFQETQRKLEHLRTQRRLDPDGTATKSPAGNKSTTPNLRNKRGQLDLRAVPVHDDSSSDIDTPQAQEKQADKASIFYMHHRHQLPHDEIDAPLTISPGRGGGRHVDETIPPVPPVPQGLISNMARLSNPGEGRERERSRDGDRGIHHVRTSSGNKLKTVSPSPAVNEKGSVGSMGDGENQRPGQGPAPGHGSGAEPVPAQGDRQGDYEWPAGFF